MKLKTSRASMRGRSVAIHGVECTIDEHGCAEVSEDLATKLLSESHWKKMEQPAAKAPEKKAPAKPVESKKEEPKADEKPEVKEKKSFFGKKGK